MERHAGEGSIEDAQKSPHTPYVADCAGCVKDLERLMGELRHGNVVG